LPRPVIDDACLLVSELVTNGVRHARTMLTVAVDCDGDRVSVAVHDDSAAAVAPRPDLSPADESGRGLALVEAVARAWGVVTGDTGKTVWFRLP
jgi:anti-sigma regulatory factor (Ser/Thr protein kinase)